MRSLLNRVRQLPKEEEKPYIPPPFSEEEKEWIDKWLHEPIPPPFSQAGKTSLAREIPSHLREDVKVPGKKKRSHLDENSISTNSLVSMNMRALDCTSRFPVVSKFSSASSDPEVKVAYMSVIQSIIVREDNLINVTRLMEHTDDMYWRYTLLRLRDKKKHDKREELSKLKKKIFLKQEEIAVALAHLRSAGVEVLRTLIAYRRLLSKINGVENPNVSIMYLGENYLLKMINDCEVFSQTLVCQLWVGFKPNTFMTPPDNHDMRALASEREALYERWVKNHMNYIREELIKAQVERRRSNMYANDGDDDGEEDLQQSQEKKDTEEGEEKEIKLELESEIDGNTDVELKKFVDYFNRSWQQRSPSSNDATQSFWDEYHHDRVLARAVAGYPDLFPRVDLVTQLPSNLQSTCMTLNEVIKKEADSRAQLDVLEARSSRLRDRKDEFTSASSIDAIISGDRAEELLFKQSTLKFRQESDKGSVYNSASQLLNLQESMEHSGPNAFLTSVHASQRTFSSPEKSGVFTLDYGDSLRLDISRVEEMVEDRVDKSRTFAKRHERTGELLLIEDNRRCNRGKPPRMTHLEAILMIQHLIRTFLRIQRFRRRRAQEKWDHSVLLVQKIVRGFLGRKMMRTHIALFRMKACIVRKYILRKQLAAQKITKFIRRAAYISRKTIALVTKKKVSMIDHDVRYVYYKEYSKLFDCSVTKIQKVWRGVLSRKRIKRFFRLRKKQIARDEATDAKLRHLTSVVAVKDDDEDAFNLLAKVSKRHPPRTGELDQLDTLSMGSRAGTPSGRVGSRTGTPRSRPNSQPATPGMDALRAFDDIDLMQQQRSSEQNMVRAVDSLNLKTSIRHSLLLPLNGNTKGKLLCGKKTEILEHTRPIDENNKSKKINNAITWRDFYRPPGSKSKTREKFLQLSHSTTSLPTLPTVRKDPLQGMTDFLKSTLTSRESIYQPTKRASLMKRDIKKDKAVNIDSTVLN